VLFKLDLLSLGVLMISTILLIILAVVVLTLIFSISKYNSLIRLSNLVKEGWSGIDIQLKRRYDLIPNLVQTVKGYAAHESGVLEKVVALRNKAMASTGIDEKSQLEPQLTQALKTVFALSESYPDLKANESFIELQKNLADVENNIQLSRRYYNGVVREYDTSISVFPGNMIANFFGFQFKPYFELDSNEEGSNVKVEF
jgi:LemA protein